MFSNSEICPGATTFGLSGTRPSHLEGSDQHFAFGKATQGLPNDSKNKQFNFGFRTNTVHKTIQKRERKGTSLEQGIKSTRVHIHFQSFPFVTLNNRTRGYKHSDDTRRTKMRSFACSVPLGL